MKLSIVTTLYYSSSYIDEFYNRCMNVAEQITNEIEIIFVNDGSPDESLLKAVALHMKDPRVMVVDLSRNFGHHKAIMTGLAQATGDLVYLVDCDLEEPPEFLAEIYGTFQKTKDVDVVYGIQSKRKGKLFERVSGYALYRLVNKISDLDMPQDIMVSRIMTRRYVNSLLEFKENELFIAGLWHIAGYNQLGIYGNKQSKGNSTYTLRKKIKLAINSITSFSNKPLYMIFTTGLLIFTMAFVYAIYLIMNRFVFSITIPGWTTVVVSIWLLGGLTLLFLGVIGIYVSVIFIETKRRPYTIIRKIWSRDGE